MLLPLLPLLLLILVACGPVDKSSAPQADSATPGETEDVPAASGAPGVSIIDMDNVAALLDAPAGAYTVVNLWATWCRPCIVEMPELAEFYRERDAGKIHFVSLSYDKPDDLGKVRAFHEKSELPFPVYVLGDMDTPEDIDEVLGTVFGGVLPTTYIFNAQGGVVKEWEGAITLDMLQEAVRALG
jgi:thiol-disulfide isomerase/thioredoxin